MVGKTGRKCSSHGINVIAGGSQGMENLYKGSPCRKSSKIAIQIHHIVVDITLEHIIWDWFYLITTFCYGCNLGPTQTARSIKGLDRRQVSFVNQRHITEEKLNQAITEVV